MKVFPASEYDARIARVRSRMADAGIDVLIATDPASMNYVTGYDGWSFYTPQGVVVPAAGDLILYTRLMDANGARVTTSLRDDQILGFPDRYVQQQDIHPNDWVAGQLLERGLGDGRIALEMDSYYFTARAYEAFRRALPQATLVDSHELVAWARAVKSPAEIAVMGEAARIMERVMAVGIDMVRPGVRQCDAVAAIQHAQTAAVDGVGGDYTAFVPMLPTGPGTSTPHLTWNDEPFRSGEATILELGACRNRYHVPMARTVFLGNPPTKLVRTAEVVREGLETALASVRPGVACEDVERAWREVISRHRLEKESRIGYSIGLAYPPDWGEHTMSFRPGDTTPIEENMCFHMILGMWMDDWGYEVSEAFRVTADGAVCFCDFSRDLVVKP